MYVTLYTSVETSDKPTPRHNEWIDEYKERDKAREVLTSQLISLAMNFAKTGNIAEIKQFVDRMSGELHRKPEPSYLEQAEEEANDFVSEYLADEIVEQLMEDGEFGEDIRNDFASGDERFNETIVDRSYGVDEAIKLLNDLYKYEEEDDGLWKGENWESALNIKAAFTYGNAVYEKATEILDEIRNAIDLEEIEEEITTTLQQRFDLSESRGEDTDWIKEYYGDDFNELLETELRKAIRDILE